MNKIFFWFLLSFLYTWALWAQKPVLQFKTYSVEEGFSDTRISDVLEDKQGLVWTVSRLGINRYNGEQTESVCLPEEVVVKNLVEDKDHIFVATSQGIFTYKKAEKEFRPLKAFPDIKQSSINEVIPAVNGGFWLAGNEGLFYWCNSLKSPTEFKSFNSVVLNPSFDHSAIRAIAEDENERLWMGNDRGDIFLFDTAKKSLEKFDIIQNDMAINDIIIDQKGRIWIATDGNGLFKYSPIENVLTHYKRKQSADGHSIDNNVVLCLVEGKEGRLYIGTDGGGINLFQPKENKFEYYTQGEGKYDLPDNAILSLTKGRNNQIWVGTVHGGISVFRDQIGVYNIPPDKLEFDEDKQGSKILEDSHGDFWLSAGRDGLRKYNPQIQQAKSFKFRGNGKGLKGNIVLSLYQDNLDRVWIGTLRNGISIYDERTKSFIPFSEGNGLRRVYAIEKATDKNIWVGSSTGIKIFNQQLDLVDNINTATDNKLSSDMITAIYKDVKGDMWVGTRNGLNLFSKEGKHKKSFASVKRDSTTLSGNYILSIGEGADFSIYVGTYGFGLNRYSRRTHDFKRIGADEGLEGNIVRGMLLDPRGNLWLSTNLGMSQLTDKGIKNYGLLDGIPPFHGGTASLGQDGRIYLAGNYGLSYFKPEKLEKEKKAPLVFFTDLIIKGKNDSKQLTPESLPQNEDHIDEVVIPSSYRWFTVNFSSSAYLDPKSVNYYYKLDGLDDEWHGLNQEHSILFSELAPGNYTLHVATTSGKQEKHFEQASLALRVKPSLWQRREIQAVIVLLAAGLIFLAVNWRNKSMKRQRDKLKRLVALRTKEVEKEKDRAYQNKLELLTKEKQNERLEQERLQDELNFKTKELTNSTLRTVSKNRLLNNIKEKLSQEAKKNKKLDAELRPLIREIKDSLMIDAEWKDFYNLFGQVHPNFITDLKAHTPSLTDRELRLCALIKLGFPSRQIATLFGISVNSVKVARHRLRKKLKIKQGNSFQDFFNQ